MVRNWGIIFLLWPGIKILPAKSMDMILINAADVRKPKRQNFHSTDDQYSLRTTAATCTTDGYKKYTCSICGTSYQETLTKLGHNYQLTNTVAATCTEDGYKQYHCSRCNSRL